MDRALRPGDVVEFKESEKWDKSKYPYEIDCESYYTIREVYDHKKGKYVDLVGIYANYPLSMFKLAKTTEGG